MAQTPKKVSDLYIKEQNNDYLKSEYIAAPHTTIVNRAPMIDLSQDLGVRFGVNRIQTQDIYQIENEVGANGEPVYGAVNDKFNQVRFVGRWTSFNEISGPRAQMVGPDITSYVEITFYGTGINLLTILNTSIENHVYSVDGGAESGNIVPSAYSNITNGRNYSQNQILPVVSGLTLGLHTVKIRNNTVSEQMIVHGFEILNERADLLVPKGSYFNDGKIIKHSTEEATAYNSGFTNVLGTAGAKGGHVVVYLDKNGVVKKDIQYTDVTPQYLGLTDHTNEEIIAKHNFREFGAGRVDDFSTLVSSSNRAYTLDDGTTTLVCVSGRADQFTAVGDNLAVDNAAANFQSITFVGTGLDILVRNDGTTRTWQDVYVDGVNIGALTSSINGSEILKVCSGLSYGTHVVRFQNSTVTSAGIADMMIYGPKKPTIEDSSKEIASYFLMADYIGNTVQGVDTIATGVLRKSPMRENIYIGTSWIVDAIQPDNYIMALGTRTNGTAGDNYSITFFGTGFEYRSITDNSMSSNISLEIDGISATAANFPSAIFSTYGLHVYNTGTAILDISNITNQRGGLRVSGLPLGLHTVKMTVNDTARLRVDAFDIITPIHSPKLNGPYVIQNTLRVGSQAVGDSRKLAEEKSNTVELSSITGIITSAHTVEQPLQETMCAIKTNGNPVEINFKGIFYASAAGNFIQTRLYVNGKLVDRNEHKYNATDDLKDQSLLGVVNLPAGTHHIMVTWYRSVGAANISSYSIRKMTVKELSKK